LNVLNAIEKGTRWAMSVPQNAATWQRVERQVGEFLSRLQAAGAFSGASSDQAFSVICDARINDEHASTGELHIVVQFAATHPGEYHCYMISHGARGSRVRVVAVNRLETPMVAVAEERIGRSAPDRPRPMHILTG
jgi:hypothetical protein